MTDSIRVDGKIIRVGLGATIALPGYNSVRVDYSEDDIVYEGDDLEAKREELFNRVDAYVDEKVKEIKNEVG